MNFLFALAALFSVGSGISARIAAGDEADAQREEADLNRLESEREANRLQKMRKAELASASMRFIKGGVTLEGSPLFVLKTQEELDAVEIEAQRTRGGALQRLGFKKARITEKKGRAALIGSLGQAAAFGAKIK